MFASEQASNALLYGSCAAVRAFSLIFCKDFFTASGEVKSVFM